MLKYYCGFPYHHSFSKTPIISTNIFGAICIYAVLVHHFGNFVYLEYYYNKACIFHSVSEVQTYSY